jgi:hypothetical protein
MQQRDPNIVRSGLSQSVTSNGITVSVEIYRLESEQSWVLEVIDQDGASTVWDDPFPADDAALDAFHECLREEGMSGLIGQTNVVPFRR